MASETLEQFHLTPAETGTNETLLAGGDFVGQEDGKTDPGPVGLMREWRGAYLILAVVPLWIFCGNLLVILAVVRLRSLRNLSNMVIASLAFTDLMLALLVVPLGVYQLVAGRWQLGLYVCLLWTGSDVVLSTTSIMHLCAIALYRYNGIANPLRMRRSQDPLNVAALVAPSWVIALALSVPFAVQGLTDSANVLMGVGGGGGGGGGGSAPQCGLFNRNFAAYSSLVSFFLPLTVMIVADVKSIQILRRNTVVSAASKRGKHGGTRRVNAGLCSSCSSPSSIEATPPSGGRSWPSMEETEDTPSSSTASLAGKPTAAAAAAVPSSGQKRRVSPGAAGLSLPRKLLFGSRGPRANDPLGRGDEENIPLHSSCVQRTNARTGRSLRRERKRSKSVIYITMLASGGRCTKANSRERRAERTLVWVFVVFVVLWLPFFTANLVYGLCEHCDVPGQVFAAFTWLGYLSSGVNPCIYTYLNSDFRDAFIKILTCRRIRQIRLRRQYS